MKTNNIYNILEDFNDNLSESDSVSYYSNESNNIEYYFSSLHFKLDLMKSYHEFLEKRILQIYNTNEIILSKYTTLQNDINIFIKDNIMEFQNFNYLINQQYQKLQSNYNILSKNYQILSKNYIKLNNNYNNLQNNINKENNILEKNYLDNNTSNKQDKNKLFIPIKQVHLNYLNKI